MTGAWYHLRLVALRQAALAPALVYVGLVALVYASDAGPPVSAATVTAVALMPTAAWLYRLVATVESLPFADITLIRLHGRTRRQLTWMVSAVLLAAALGAAAAGWARLANPHPYPAPTLVLIGVLHLAQALAGVGLGCLISRPLPVPVGRRSWQSLRLSSSRWWCFGCHHSAQCWRRSPARTPQDRCRYSR